MMVKGDHHSAGHDTDATTASEEKYGLRPRTIIKRLQQERVRQQVPKRTVRAKSRPAPLSKYRRKTANARERHRMKEINNAFESLRKVLPDVVEVEAASSSMTKITTLRLAVSYIRTLSHVLEDEGVSSLHGSLHNSLQQSLQHSLQRSCCPTTTPSPDNTFPHHHQSAPSLTQHYPPQAPQLSTCYSSASHTSCYSSASHTSCYSSASHTSCYSTASHTSSPSTLRGSLGSTSDLEDLLSDDSCLLEDNLDVFHDIPTLSVADPFDILLGAERDTLVFTTELCN